ncbi:hypothetical protein WJX84_006244 [Apatococcus fuscideae]|uniref:Uncharacterized protein n=1 Tax=Apatococcus fuscideae TaxID=2026836 RepID=A0AAW1T5T0_9CHLO
MKSPGRIPGPMPKATIMLWLNAIIEDEFRWPQYLFNDLLPSPESHQASVARAEWSPYMAGIKAAAEGEHAVALDHFDWAISAEPDQPYNYLGRAGSKAVMGDREGFLLDLETARDLGGRAPQLFYDVCLQLIPQYTKAHCFKEALHLTKEVVAQTEEPAAWLRVAAWLHIRLQQLPEASEDLRRAEEAEPGHARTLHLRGYVKWKTGDPRGALTDLTAAKALIPDSPEISHRRAQVLHSLGKTTPAFREIEWAKRLRPGHFGTRKLRLQLLMALGDFKGAMWQLKWLLAARRPDSELLLAAAECHRAVNDPHGILPTIADALKRSPTSLQLLLTAAKLRCQLLDLEGAQEACDAAEALVPMDVRVGEMQAIIRRTHHKAGIQHNRPSTSVGGDSIDVTGQRVLATYVLENGWPPTFPHKAVSAAPPFPDVAWLHVDAPPWVPGQPRSPAGGAFHDEKGSPRGTGPKPAEALHFTRLAMEEASHDFVVRNEYKRAMNAAHVGRVNEAGSGSASAEEEEARHLMFRKFVFVKMRRGEFKSAMRRNEDVLQRFPKSASALLMKSLLHLKLGKPQAALDAAKQALQNEPSNTKALIQQGPCLLELGRPAEALEVAMETLVQDPQNLYALQAAFKAVCRPLGRSWLQQWAPSACSDASSITTPPVVRDGALESSAKRWRGRSCSSRADAGRHCPPAASVRRFRKSSWKVSSAGNGRL